MNKIVERAESKNVCSEINKEKEGVNEKLMKSKLNNQNKTLIIVLQG